MNQMNESSKQPEIRYEHDGIFIRHNDYHNKYAYEHIQWVEACGSYCDFHLAGGIRLTVTHRLGFVMNKLPSSLFVRIHRSYAVRIRAVERFIGNTFYVGKRELPIGRVYRFAAFSCLNILETTRFLSSRAAGRSTSD